MDDTSTAIAFDSEDRMSAYGIPASGLALLTAGYLADGMRAWKESSNSSRTYYLYDGSAPLAELNTTGSLIAYDTVGANGLISRRVGTASVFYTFDLTGSVSTATDGAGHVLGDEVFNAAGQRENTCSTRPVDFCGQWGYHFDDETGLVLAGHRYYDPYAARFLTRDPISYNGGINLYSYTRNDFVNEVDPSGGFVSIGPFFRGLIQLGGLGAELLHNLVNPDGPDPLAPGMKPNVPPDTPPIYSPPPPGYEPPTDPGEGPIYLCPTDRNGGGGPGFTQVPAPASPSGGDSGGDDAGIGGSGIGGGSGPYDPTPAVTSPTEPGVAPEGGGCVAGDTPVLMADGALKPIALVQPGDLILTIDPDTNRVVAQRVLNTESVLVQDTYVVSFSDGEKIEMSREHPLYVPGRGFVHASDFTEGLECSALNGKGVTITSLSPAHHFVRVFGLRVSLFQNYFVGEAAIRTHK